MPQNPLRDLISGMLPTQPSRDKNGQRVPWATTGPDPNPRAKAAFEGVTDTLLGALGVRDPLAADATKATGLGSLLGMLGPAAVIGGVKRIRNAPQQFQQIRTHMGDDALGQLLYDWDEAFLDQDGLLRKTLSDRYSSTGRQAEPRVAPSHFISWLGSPSAEDVSKFSPETHAEYLELVRQAKAALALPKK